MQYNQNVHNWSIDTTRLKKNSEIYEKFLLEQKINFGLNGTKLSKKALQKHWSALDIDSLKKAFLRKIVWPQS